ncbi:MAG: aminoglycoside phosphotransferase family protein, partial [Burkholderiaceae bacterium]
MNTIESLIGQFLVRNGLAETGEPLRCTPLAGGVSSDIWRVDGRLGPVCVKRALPKLKVAADWQAPVSRNAYEWAWLSFAA